MSEEMIRTAVSNYLAAICAKDVDAWLATYAPDGVSHDPVGTPPLVGKEALRQFFNSIADLFETLSMGTDQVFIGGNCAAFKFTGQGRGKNGRDVTFEGIDIFEVNDEGQIQKVMAYWDAGALLKTLTE